MTRLPSCRRANDLRQHGRDAVQDELDPDHRGDEPMILETIADRGADPGATIVGAASRIKASAGCDAIARPRQRRPVRRLSDEHHHREIAPGRRSRESRGNDRRIGSSGVVRGNVSFLLLHLAQRHDGEEQTRRRSGRRDRDAEEGKIAPPAAANTARIAAAARDRRGARAGCRGRSEGRATKIGAGDRVDDEKGRRKQTANCSSRSENEVSSLANRESGSGLHLPLCAKWQALPRVHAIDQ